MDPILKSFDDRFAALNRRSLELLSKISSEYLFRRPREMNHSMAMFSTGEYLLRSAATVEQTCLGIMTRLWDDPFEWTLPEKLSTPSLIADYLGEVESTRQKAFRFFNSDDDLRSRLPAPETLSTIFELLLDTLSRAEHFQGRAFAIFQMYSDEKLPRV